MFRFFSKTTKNISKTLPVKNNPLGRWERPTTKQREDIKVLLANHDSCGGKSCETPVDLKQEITNIIQNKIM